jgi:hypothetical protein
VTLPFVALTLAPRLYASSLGLLAPSCQAPCPCLNKSQADERSNTIPTPLFEHLNQNAVYYSSRQLKKSMQTLTTIPVLVDRQRSRRVFDEQKQHPDLRQPEP